MQRLNNTAVRACGRRFASTRRPMIKFTFGTDRAAIDGTLPWNAGGAAPAAARASAAPAAPPAAPAVAAAATNQLGGPRRWTIFLPEGTPIRAELDAGSRVVGNIQPAGDAEVAELRGASARIVQPLQGWAAVGQGARLTLRGWA
eukprot:Hpha_TRINITY_DN21123_c0_g1::TRINITY_DN21123_c0_g1_i1::g.25298::m.25298